MRRTDRIFPAPQSRGAAGRRAPGTASGASSMHPLEDAVPAHRPRPAPDLPGLGVLADREEDHFSAADQILERHVADAALVAGEAGIARIVAIVAHHEIVPRRDLVDLGVVEGAVVAVDLDDLMLDAAGQRLDVAERFLRLAEMVDRRERRHLLA